MKMRKGFTLVELLIVIVIIGILAAAMLLSSGSATAAAKASNIISDLRSMKTAALMVYADSQDAFDRGSATFSATDAAVKNMLGKYVDNPEKYAANFICANNSTTHKWFVGYTIPTTEADASQIADKLAGKAKSVGLFKTTDIGDNNVFTSGRTVYMVAR